MDRCGLGGLNAYQLYCLNIVLNNGHTIEYNTKQNEGKNIVKHPKQDSIPFYIEQAMLILQNNTNISKYSDKKKLMKKAIEQ